MVFPRGSTSRENFLMSHCNISLTMKICQLVESNKKCYWIFKWFWFAIHSALALSVKTENMQSPWPSISFSQHFILRKKCTSMYTNRHDKNAVAVLFMLAPNVYLHRNRKVNLGISIQWHIKSPLSFSSDRYIHATPMERVLLESNLPILHVDKCQGWMPSLLI